MARSRYGRTGSVGQHPTSFTVLYRAADNPDAEFRETEPTTLLLAQVAAHTLRQAGFFAKVV